MKWIWKISLSLPVVLGLTAVLLCGCDSGKPAPSTNASSGDTVTEENWVEDIPENEGVLVEDEQDLPPTEPPEEGDSQATIIPPVEDSEEPGGGAPPFFEGEPGIDDGDWGDLH